MIQNKTIKLILEKYKTIWALRHFSALAEWDLDTYMPKEGAEGRGEALAKLEVLIQTTFLEDSFVELINKADKEKLNDAEKGIIRRLKYEIDYYQKLPKEFIEKFEKAQTESNISWRNAREKNDFSLFEKPLENIINLSKEMAEYLGYEKHPYDALLNRFEEELTVEELDKYFIELKPKIISLLRRIESSKEFKKEHELEKEPYELEKMKVLDNEILKLIHYNMEHLRLDVSPHPFSTSIGPGDARITTRYDKEDFRKAYTSTIHEYGHALYEIQTHEDTHYTPIQGGTSTIIHESQSRLWENVIGRSKEFISLLKKNLNDMNPNLANYTVDDLFKYLNLVRPSLIRTEADEVTYHLHIMIRYEIEKELMEGKIEVKDLPKIWDNKYKEYLGIKADNYSDGVLQDVHWSHGYIGYFPTYSLGTALSVTWKHYMEKDLGNVYELIKTKDGISKIQKWQKDNMHQYGSTYTFKELVKKITKEEFSTKHLIDYLEDKYKSIYKL